MISFTYTSLHIKVGVDTSTATEVYSVAMNNRTTLASLDVYTCCVTRYDLIFLDEDFVLRTRLDHDTATLEMLEFALFNTNFGIYGDKACSRSIVRGISLQLAVDHFDRGAV